jgi:glutamyl-tRNA(Gln) amidotransferase subunit D
MSYPRKVSALLKRAGVEVGDEVLVRCGDKSYRGVVMPNHSFSGRDVLTIKLPNGYNIGLEVVPELTIEKVAEAATRARPPQKLEEDVRKPTVSFLGTGGTIASYVDYRTGAVYPALTAEELAFSVPELSDLCNVKARVLFSIFSEDMRVENWRVLARQAASELNEGSKAVVVPHGTDTLGFTSAALSFMLRDLTGPVILVGAQRSSDRPSSDAYLNLKAAARLASSNLGEVVAVMHEETSDLYCTVHRGTKVRKMHSSRRDAFKSINAKPLGRVDAEGEVTWFEGTRPRSEGPVQVDDRMEEDVSLLYTYPNMEPEIFEACAQHSLGIVLAGTGLGHVPKNLVPRIKRAVREGVQIVMTSQCLYGRVGMYVYSRGRELVKAGVIPGEDMLPETALVKLMWVLGHTTDPEEVRTLMTTNLVGEINPRLGIEDFEV